MRARINSYYEEHPLACPKCHGRGKYNDFVQFTTYKGDQTCIHCKGRGRHPLPFTELYDLKEGPISWHKVKK